jgi:hypothetical protein
LLELTQKAGPISCYYDLLVAALLQPQQIKNFIGCGIASLLDLLLWHIGLPAC